ncbi:hypothetical protein [Flavisolibacter tropicus]|uniref:Uncharacterized protein n=1 Tax=Flavisolibacter tropicus TaxID=1492898 RepID=A0A172U1L4_9BACT|nr:hypothetical protein [Flavisolibacter tropicus]ANE53146.1 hypothetical protein SY85_24405 [Flavisolibacter tropicus]
MMQQTDLLTGEKFLAKRRNQRFSSASNRIKYHNNRASQLRLEKSSINRPLHVNYNILSELMKGKKEAIFHKQYLLGKGFDFGVSTHIDTYNGNRYHATYCYIIVPCEKEQFKIVRR